MSNPFYDPKRRIHLRTGEEAYQDYLDRRKKDKSDIKGNKGKQKTFPKIDPDFPLDLSKFIKLNSFTSDGNPASMLVAKYAMQINQEIGQALNSLGYLAQVKDAQNNITQKGYTKENIWINDRLGSLNWYEQIPLAESLGCSRMNNKQALDFHNLLANGLEGKAVVSDGRDNALDKDEINDILEKLKKKEDPWRSEYLDTRFEVADDKVIMYSGHYTDQSLPLQERIKPENIKYKFKKELLKNNISMQNGWTKFKNFNEDGLCTALEQSNEIYSWFPRNNAVAGLYADSGGFVLGCDRVPLDSVPWLGMRLAKILR